MTDASGTAETARPDTVVSGTTGTPRPPAEPGSGQDWTDQVTGLIVDSVDKVRTRTTGPILEVTRGSVHAVVAVTLLLPVAVLFLVLTVRVLTYYVFREVWITYTVLGMLFTLVGVVMWSRRHAGAPQT
jgi:hypothetical protein